MWGHGWNGMGWMGMGWGGWIMMIVIVLTVWAVVAVAGIALFRGLRTREIGTRDGTAAPTSDAGRLLDERFARGEIDSDEYTARRETLRASR
ncbi:MAG TPA: SHOCT domain-containing protein [Microlunatus sp.]